MNSFLVTDTIIHSIAQLVDDSNNSGNYREPSHSDIEFQINVAGLSEHDPKSQGQVIGKAKRVRAVLYGASESDPARSARFVVGLLAKVRACGGFRSASANYVGDEAIANAKGAFESEGFVLASDGSIAPKVLESLAGRDLSTALLRYADRARRGAEDAALLSGTGKDLLEATAAHALVTLNGAYSANLNFQSLLGMAFIALEMAVPELPEQPGELPTKLLERGMFQSALAINRLRNKQGTGHGRPWLPVITDHEAKAAIETVGTIAAYMLAKLEKKYPSRS
jgi:hypothetical protein